MGSTGVVPGIPLGNDDERWIGRFLVLGYAGSCYRACPPALTGKGNETVLRVARQRGAWLVERVLEVAATGRAVWPHPALFTLAAVSALADGAGRRAALSALPAVCRTSAELFLFAGYVEQFRGWGRGLRRAVAGWYLRGDVEELARHAVTRRQHGWSHRDLLRLAHPSSDDPARRALFGWLASGALHELDTPPLIRAYVAAPGAPRRPAGCG